MKSAISPKAPDSIANIAVDMVMSVFEQAVGCQGDKIAQINMTPRRQLKLAEQGLLQN